MSLFKNFFRKTPDPISGLTHFIGALLAIVALVVLLTRTSTALTSWHYVGFSIFGGSMFLLYLASTLYHCVPVKDHPREIFRKIDHIMIFVFISATYTPICLVTLRGGWGWSLFGVVWGLSVAGIFLKLFKMNAPRFLSTLIYLMMGWIIIVGIFPLAHSLQPHGIKWMGFGGLFYTIGAVIYAMKKPNPIPGIFGFHEVFHVFVMAGTFSHFWMIYQFV